ncbi:FAD binding domain-containing protein [bacterium]|nr:FAD binding domain-containing protein [bacterium]
MKAQIPRSAFLGGGTSINSLSWEKRVNSGRSQAYEALIDVSALDLGTVEKRDGFIRIGANLRFQDVFEHPLCPELLRAGFKQIVNRNVRNMATVAGSIAMKSPCSNVIAALMTLHAEVETADANGRRERVSLESFVNTSSEGLLITAVYIPEEWTGLHCSTRRYSRSQNDISIVLADVALEAADGKITRVSAVAGGVAPRVVRLVSLEAALLGQALPDAEAVGDLVKKDIAAISDFRGSAEFKAYMAGQLIDWCLHMAVDGAECCACGCEHKG